MKRIFIILSAFILMTSCEKWLDVNVDPNNPSEIDVTRVLPGVYYDIGDIFGIGYSNLGYVTSVYVHQLTTREAYDQYGVTGGSFAMTDNWSTIFSQILPQLNILIEKAEEDDNLVYAGIGKILKAYVYGQVVDVWGDVPYDDADVVAEYNPTFTDDEVIYGKLLTLVDAGIADLENEDAENLLVPGDDDLIYSGSVAKWIRAGNTVKLKLLLTVRKTSLYDQTAVNTLIAGDGADLIQEGDNFWIPFGPSEAPDNRNTAFVLEYSGSQISNYISPWFYEIMRGQNPDIYTANPDPRIPYYFVDQLSASENPENPPEYRQGTFVTIYFGSTGANRDHGGRNTFAMMGLYPCGGAFDGPGLSKSDGLGKDDGTGAAPYKMITYADVLFMRAELKQVGASSDAAAARDLLEDGIWAAFEQVDDISSIAATAGATIPDLVGHADGDDTTYVNNVLADFDAGDDNRKLEHIMTQKWLAAWGSSVESYNDYRRTGYPVMFDPMDNNLAPGGFVSGGPDGSGPVPVTSGRSYALSLPWSNDELSLNSSSPSQKTPSASTVFWDVD